MMMLYCLSALRPENNCCSFKMDLGGGVESVGLLRGLCSISLSPAWSVATWIVTSLPFLAGLIFANVGKKLLGFLFFFFSPSPGLEAFHQQIFLAGFFVVFFFFFSPAQGACGAALAGPNPRKTEPAKEGTFNSTNFTGCEKTHARNPTGSQLLRQLCSPPLTETKMGGCHLCLSATRQVGGGV